MKTEKRKRRNAETPKPGLNQRTTFHANELGADGKINSLEGLLDDDPMFAAGKVAGRRDGREECFELVCAAAREAEGISSAARQRKQREEMAGVRLRLHQVGGAIRKGMVVGCDVPVPTAKRGPHRLPARFGNVIAPAGRVYHCV